MFYIKLIIVIEFEVKGIAFTSLFICVKAWNENHYDRKM